MATYKIRNEQGDLITTTDLAQVMEAKGIKRLGQTAAAARAARARLVPARSFGLINFVAQNDTAGYVKAWREQNHLTN